MKITPPMTMVAIVKIVDHSIVSSNLSSSKSLLRLSFSITQADLKIKSQSIKMKIAAANITIPIANRTPHPGRSSPLSIQIKAN